MNLSIRNTLGSINQHTSEILDRLGTEGDLKVQVAEAREQLAENVVLGKQLIASLESLDTIRGSLEASGFSDEWFNIVNSDGSFLEGINVDLVNLLGNDEEKGAVCMEGLLQTIGTILKKIWDWIVDMFHRLVAFVSKLIRAWRGDGHVVDKCVKSLEIVLAGETIEEKLEKIGKKVNEAGTRGGLNYDIRELITRFSIDMDLACFLCKATPEVCGSKAPYTKPNDLVGQAFLEYCGEGRNPPNIIMKKLMDSVESDPGSVTYMSPVVGFSGTKFVDNPKALKSMMEKAGYSLSAAGGVITFNKGTIDTSISPLDYPTLFKSVDDYKNILIAWKSLLARSGMSDNSGIAKYINQSQVFLRSVGDAARTYANNLKQSREMGTGADVALERGLQKQAQWVAEVVMHISYLVTDMERIRLLCTRIITVIESEASKK